MFRTISLFAWLMFYGFVIKQMFGVTLLKLLQMIQLYEWLNAKYLIWFYRQFSDSFFFTEKLKNPQNLMSLRQYKTNTITSTKDLL